MNKLLLLLAFLVTSSTAVFSESIVLNNSFILKLPDELALEKKQDFISSYNQNHLYQQIYSCRYRNRAFLLHAYCKIKLGKSLDAIADRYEIPILRAPTRFGSDQLPEQILNEGRSFVLSDDFTSVHYAMINGYSFGKNDLAAFFFTMSNHPYFDEVLVQINNIWMDPSDSRIEYLNTEVIEREIANGNNNAELYSIFKNGFEKMKFISP